MHNVSIAANIAASNKRPRLEKAQGIGLNGLGQSGLGGKPNCGGVSRQAEVT